jgi:DNA-binding NtrC family response regulator
MNQTMKNLVFKDPRSRALLEQITKVAATDHAVLITGPTGSGKEVVARLLHDLSERRNQPFQAPNCGAISEKLFEDAFFGHVKGAFAGAHCDKAGYLAAAHGGTLFLDELGELPLDHQAKLLRVLDGHPYYPVGSSKPRTADVRFVAATNQDLHAMIRDRRFREDLYGRLSCFVLKVPPLAERPADVDALARLRAAQKRPGDTQFADEVTAAAARLHACPDPWPRGIRDLQALVARADCFGVDQAEQDLRADWQRRGPASPAATWMVEPALSRHDDRDALAGLIQARLNLQKRRGRPMAAAGAAHALASMLLERQNVPHADIQDVLGVTTRQTLESNLRPLCDSGLLVDGGDMVTLFWPPVVVRFLHKPAHDWEIVPPGAVPSARTGDCFCIAITSQLPVEARFYFVTHHGMSRTPRLAAGKRFVASGQSKHFEFALVDGAGFEQILVHIAWPTSRGIQEIEVADDVEVDSFDMPGPHALQKERAALLDEVGPGWIMEYLIQHVA